MPEYRILQKDRTHVLAAAGHDDALLEALASRAGCAPLDVSGRGAVFRFTCGAGEGILREYRRGGAMRFFLRDAFFLCNRPLREFKAHAFLEEKGFPVPPLLGAAWEWRGPFLRGRIATGRVGGEALPGALARSAAPEEALRRCGAHIREMHRLGVWHADLHVLNLLLDGERWWFLDFDNAVGPKPLGTAARARNLLRLRRSFEKHGLPEAWFAALLEGYGDIRIPWWLDALYRLRGRAGKRDNKRGIWEKET